MVTTALNVTLKPGNGVATQYALAKLNAATDYSDVNAAVDSNYKNIFGDGTFQCDSVAPGFGVNLKCFPNGTCNDLGANTVVNGTYIDMYACTLATKTCVYDKSCSCDGTNCVDFALTDINRPADNKSRVDGSDFWYSGSTGFDGKYGYKCNADKDNISSYINVLCLDSSNGFATNDIKCTGKIDRAYEGFVSCKATTCSEVPVNYCASNVDLYVEAKYSDTCRRKSDGSACESTSDEPSNADAITVVIGLLTLFLA